MSSDWLISTVAGAVIGVLLRYLIRIPEFLRRYIKKEPLEGEWHEYHATFAGGEHNISGGIWKIKKGFMNKFEVSFKHNLGGTLEYKGALYEERGHIVAELKSVSHRNESLYYRFINPIASGYIVPGIWLSFEREGRICSGASILSKEEIAPRSVPKLLNKAFESYPEFPALVIKA